jgi:hypothetical protein
VTLHTQHDGYREAMRSTGPIEIARGFGPNDWASQSAATAVLRTQSAMPARLVEMLHLEGIRIEQVA